MFALREVYRLKSLSVITHRRYIQINNNIPGVNDIDV